MEESRIGRRYRALDALHDMKNYVVAGNTTFVAEQLASFSHAFGAPYRNSGTLLDEIEMQREWFQTLIQRQIKVESYWQQDPLFEEDMDTEEGE
jgi:hypothetical protein